MIFLCDVDDVVADLISTWCNRWNDQTGDNLTPEKIKTWDVNKYCSVEDVDHMEIYDILDHPDLYDDVEPIEGSEWGVATLRSLGWRVVFVTATNPNCAGQKMLWLRKHGFILEDDDRYRDFYAGYDKNLLYGDVFLDDGPHNINPHPAERKLLFDHPHNRSAELEPDVVRVKDWRDVIERVEMFSPKGLIV